jgi:hypothetical protein
MTDDPLWFTKDKRDVATKLVQHKLMTELQIGKNPSTHEEIIQREKLYLQRFTEEINRFHSSTLEQVPGMNHKIHNEANESNEANEDEDDQLDSEVDIEDECYIMEMEIEKGNELHEDATEA